MFLSPRPGHGPDQWRALFTASLLTFTVPYCTGVSRKDDFQRSMTKQLSSITSDNSTIFIHLKICLTTGNLPPPASYFYSTFTRESSLELLPGRSSLTIYYSTVCTLHYCIRNVQFLNRRPLTKKHTSTVVGTGRYEKCLKCTSHSVAPQHCPSTLSGRTWS